MGKEDVRGGDEMGLERGEVAVLGGTEVGQREVLEWASGADNSVSEQGEDGLEMSDVGRIELDSLRAVVEQKEVPLVLGISD
ncbi:uncharacterized protein A4U43_UnF9830 [Asparagus officinalis]|uniref:Uncharacterized protein n=1 Tax=Asparagus officinalis TaxID=4686 RepID=A0A1R3L5M9_ASPOF|nr:uncharacterized protein A4U43_UnF9830 [Asparagus officinalis]